VQRCPRDAQPLRLQAFRTTQGFPDELQPSPGRWLPIDQVRVAGKGRQQGEASCRAS
jgi:hypothetical protein